MPIKPTTAALIVFVTLTISPAWAQITADEQEFQQLGAALRADDAERQSAIATCIAQSSGADAAGIATLLGVPPAQAWTAWCTRMTNGIADGKLTLADLTALNDGTITPRARIVLSTISDGE